MKKKISRKEIIRKWFLINLIARKNQNLKHYLEALQEWKKLNPRIKLKGGKTASIKSIEPGNSLDESGNPLWYKITILSYDVLDPDKFYDSFNNQDVVLDLDPNIVANKTESQLIFFPKCHTFAYGKAQKISVNNMAIYLGESFNKVEDEGFDVHIYNDKATLDQIRNAYSIIGINSKFTYANPGDADDFIEIYDVKNRESGAKLIKTDLVGTEKNPLKYEKGGLIDAILTSVQRNGEVEARIKEVHGEKIRTVKSKEYPLIFYTKCIAENLGITLYEEVKKYSKTL